ncbi:CCR4-NOT transcription complex subunit 4 [Apostasia shenzhenica]|uniref:CCR4-NOT transcription complex subunit 4 n=1 Tax=Apostasia shenzhenica TaxID=1088818 RepID=A0A2I0B673_9ASPA|nr:CCR4-NOT transcription complex subunit 4 [Apostasia shenzhenica]
MPSFQRTNMSDDGDRVCPLCAEEMDLTDQHLKPCKCGYEICVWCWHHIMEMAEKDETEGRCPACRTPYDKQRIIGMTANCERLVAEICAEKRQKLQKTKLKVSAETRKQLSTVRVIQRNLVYIMGLPANLCDESLLERKEYFGQYGKVLKVSISHSASAANQQSSNTFSVYITYAREEEAVRCIQAVHNYMLDGKSLRACFGTNKYCHAWLRNMNCTNPDCLYLHDISAQDDSFTKDEIISAYTRSRVSQTSHRNLQRRGGSVLPPAADDLASKGTATNKSPVSKVAVVHTGESNIISNILSLDFDPWEDSLSVSDSFSKLLCENEGNNGSLILSKRFNTENNNQSRFSFARQEVQENVIGSSIENITSLQSSSASKVSCVDNFHNGFIENGFLDKSMIKSNVNISDRPAALGVSRAKLSAPPGFSVPIRPPPGFSVHDRYDQNINTNSGNSGDLEFLDPAILAVGKGCMLNGSSDASFSFSSAFPAPFSSEECDPRLKLLMHQSVSSHQNVRFPDFIRESFLPVNNSHDMSRLLAQSQGTFSPLTQLSIQQPRSSPVSSAHWDGWNNMQSSTAVGMPKYLRNDRFGLNSYFPGSHEHKFHLPSSTDIYSRAFGI